MCITHTAVRYADTKVSEYWAAFHGTDPMTGPRGVTADIQVDTHVDKREDAHHRFMVIDLVNMAMAPITLDDFIEVFLACYELDDATPEDTRLVFQAAQLCGSKYTVVPDDGRAIIALCTKALSLMDSESILEIQKASNPHLPACFVISY